jgi:hypothetical protein
MLKTDYAFNQLDDVLVPPGEEDGEASQVEVKGLFGHALRRIDAGSLAPRRRAI